MCLSQSHRLPRQLERVKGPDAGWDSSLPQGGCYYSALNVIPALLSTLLSQPAARGTSTTVREAEAWPQ